MSRYAEVHDPNNTKGPGDARPTALQIIKDEGLVGKLNDKVFVVTGVSSGIGVETIRAFYATGAHVIGTVRDLEKGEKVVEEVKAKTQGGKITLVKMEMDDLASVKKGAADMLSHSKTINILVNNAGVMATPEGKTKDGFETQFGTNHIGHFLLFQLLKPTLLSTATPSFPSRVVSLSSMGHRFGGIRTHDYNFTEPGSYIPWVAYGQAKTANIYLANEIERRYGQQNLHATSLHPGGIMTGLQKHIDMSAFEGASESDQNYIKSVEQGAATSVWAAVGKEWEHKGGRYLADCQEMGPFKHSGEPLFIGDDGYESWAFDEGLAKTLWRDSLKMVGMEGEE